MDVKQMVQISVVALGLISPAISPYTLAGETGYETDAEPVAVTTEVSRTVVPDGGMDIGISSRDGITFSAPDVLITRNGVTEILARPVTLPNGTRVMPNGTIILASGARVWLRPEQVLSLGGQLQNAPIAVAVTENTDAIIDVSRTAAIGTGVSRARPAARRGSARALAERLNQSVAPIQNGTSTRTMSPVPASTLDQAPVIAPTSTPQYVDPEVEFLEQ